MTGEAWLASACLAGAVLLLGASPERRVRRFARGVRPRGAVARRWWTTARPTPGGSAPADDCASAVAELATLLRSGLPPERAWAAVAGSGRRGADLDAALAAAAGASSVGGDVAAALRSCACRDAALRQGLAALASTWEVSSAAGAPAAAVLDRLAATLREEADLRDARATAMAAPRASARVLVALPVVGLGLGQLVGAAPLPVLVGSAVGRVCGVTGVLLAAVAWWWTRRLVRTAESA